MHRNVNRSISLVKRLAGRINLPGGCLGWSIWADYEWM